MPSGAGANPEAPAAARVHSRGHVRRNPARFRAGTRPAAGVPGRSPRYCRCTEAVMPASHSKSAHSVAMAILGKTGSGAAWGHHQRFDRLAYSPGERCGLHRRRFGRAFRRPLGIAGEPPGRVLSVMRRHTWRLAAGPMAQASAALHRTMRPQPCTIVALAGGPDGKYRACRAWCHQPSQSSGPPAAGPSFHRIFTWRYTIALDRPVPAPSAGPCPRWKPKRWRQWLMAFDVGDVDGGHEDGGAAQGPSRQRLDRKLSGGWMLAGRIQRRVSAWPTWLNPEPLQDIRNTHNPAPLHRPPDGVPITPRRG